MSRLAGNSAAASLDIVIVSWNNGEELAACVSSIAARAHEVNLSSVTVVDNASTVDPSANLATFDTLPLRVIRNERNRGFGAACNQGAARGSATYLLFLNPDTRLREGALAAAVDVLETRPEVGICGVRMISDDGTTARSCARFPTPLRLVGMTAGIDRIFPAICKPHLMVEWDHATNRDVDQVIGAFFLVRRGLFEALEGFDERFFVYYEEVDFSLRAVRRGARTAFVAAAAVDHHGGWNSGRARAARLFYNVRSRMIYARKHFSFPAALCVMAASLVIEPFSRLARAVGRGAGSELAETIRAYSLLWRRLLRGALLRNEPLTS